jgi:hypothetical protein
LLSQLVQYFALDESSRCQRQSFVSFEMFQNNLRLTQC